MNYLALLDLPIGTPDCTLDSTCGLRISESPTSDNLTHKKPQNRMRLKGGQMGADLSYSVSDAVAED
jgi:hypothetical protein